MGTIYSYLHSGTSPSEDNACPVERRVKVRKVSQEKRKSKLMQMYVILKLHLFEHKGPKQIALYLNKSAGLVYRRIRECRRMK